MGEVPILFYISEVIVQEGVPCLLQTFTSERRKNYNPGGYMSYVNEDRTCCKNYNLITRLENVGQMLHPNHGWLCLSKDTSYVNMFNFDFFLIKCISCASLNYVRRYELFKKK